MNAERVAPAVATVACLLVVALLLAPYVLLPERAHTGLSTYYASGILDGTFVALVSTLVLVTAIALIGGYRGQSPADFVSGLATTVGVIVVLLVVEWALAVEPETVQSIAAATWLADHRWWIVAATAIVPLASIWYAVAVLSGGSTRR